MITVADATLDWLDRLPHPRPIQERIPLLIGGNGRRVLAYAAERADVVGITGLGRTLADGHAHDVEWSVEQIDTRVGFLRSVERPLAIDSLVQMVVLTDDRRATADVLGTEHGLDPEQLLACPYALLGTPTEVAAEIAAHRERWGITRYTVRADAFDAVGAIRDELVAAGIAVA
jgi:alkanesulfonate monooxygenase SsuD/methylene tetrahydromethanopterin reductase-like flavin-dependent oxidoreductase (luciferase family)